MEKRDELYAGKAKSVYTTDDADKLIMLFRDDTSAFDGKKKEALARKGLVKKLEMIPVECVVRNITAGSICRRLGVEEGLELTPPTFEFFLKNDDLGDPMVNDFHIRSFGWATDEQVAQMKTLTFQVNEVLKQLFLDGGMLLVDYKLEFGVFNGEVLLGDEFSPDGCRLWDKNTREKLDKDRFRQGLGGVVEAYEEVGRRLGMQFQY